MRFGKDECVPRQVVSGVPAAVETDFGYGRTANHLLSDGVNPGSALTVEGAYRRVRGVERSAHTRQEV